MTATTPAPVSVQIEADVAIITINRPEKLGALTRQMRLDIAREIRAHGGADSGMRGIILTGTGRAFSAGEDLQETGEDLQAAGGAGVDELRQAVESFHDITRAINETKVPVIAALNGLAVGGASEVTMSCDARIGSERAAFFLPENQIGIAVSNASSIFLRRLVGNHAMRIILESPRIESAEALEIGLLDQVVAPEKLIDEALALAHRWNPVGGATAQHLALLRPTAEEIAVAFERENAAAQAVWDSGVLQAGVERFWAEKH